jgi:fatty acid synthase
LTLVLTLVLTLLGIYHEIKEMLESLSEKGVFVRQLQSNDIPYHSKYLLTCAQEMVDEIKKFIPNPKPRSKKWISTAVLDNDTQPELSLASAEYFVHNLVNPVYFYNRVKYMPSDAIVIEVGPHGLFSKVVTETLDSGTYVSLMKRDSNDTNLDMFLGAIAKLYELGFNPSIENLYPKVQWPVSRGTQSIGSLMHWDHSKSYSSRGYPDYKHRETSSDFNENIDIANSFKNFYPDHKIDDNIIFPAAGYIVMAWKRMAYSYGKLWYQLPVIFEDVQFRRPAFLSYDEPTKIKVRYLRQSGETSVSIRI